VKSRILAGLLVAASALLSVVLAVTVNVATGGSVPAWLQWFQPWAWPGVAVLITLVMATAVWQQRLDKSGRDSTRRTLARGRKVMKDQDPSLASLLVPHQLPAGVTNFTGRLAELATLDGIIEKPGVRGASTAIIAAIDGTAGVGKTALAVHWAGLVRDRFPDGQLYANLQGCGPGPPATTTDILSRFVRAFGIRAVDVPRDSDELVGLYRSLLADRRVIVLLDNTPGADQVRPLLPGSSGSLVLITSRNRLTGLAVRDGAQRISLDLFPLQDAVTLIHHVVGIRSDTQTMVSVELAEMCACLPLAIRIACERIADRPQVAMADLVDELRDARKRLRLLDSDSDIYVSLHTVYSWSYRGLDAGTAKTFRLLGLHAGAEFSAPAIAALADADLAIIDAQLDRLVDRNLLEVSGHNRYRLHDLLRSYAAEQVRKEESPRHRAAAVRRLLVWYLHAAVAADALFAPERHPVPVDPPPHGCQPLSFANRNDAARWCEAERLNVGAAIRQALEHHEYAIAWQLPAVIGEFLHVRRYFTDLVELHQLGLKGATLAHDICGQSWVRTNLGIAYVDLAQFELALDQLRPAVDDLRGLVGDSKFSLAACHVIGVALSTLGMALEGSGDLISAIDSYAEALAIQRTTANRWGEARTLGCLGLAYARSNQYRPALRYLNESLLIHQEMGNRWQEGSVLTELAATYMAVGDLDRSLQLYQRAATVNSDLSNRWGEAQALVGLGNALNLNGKLRDARVSWRSALAILDELNDPGANVVRGRLRPLGNRWS
jgi:tetratricopeptide (TPR) repeat protein